jgi:tetratricopeptide (TPR) repeat protein
MKKNARFYWNCLATIIFTTIALQSIVSKAETPDLDIKQSDKKCLLDKTLTNNTKQAIPEETNTQNNLEDDSREYSSRSYTYYEQGNLSEAIECMRIAVQLAPKYWLDTLRDRGEPDLNRGKESYDRGWTAYQRNRSSKVIENFFDAAINFFKNVPHEYCRKEVENQKIYLQKTSRLQEPSTQCLVPKKKKPQK